MKEVIQENKKIFMILAALGAILVVILIALFAISLDKDGTISTPSGWETYDKNGIKFSYPKNFSLQSDYAETGSILIANKTEFPTDKENSEDFLMLQFGLVNDEEFNKKTVGYLNDNNCSDLAKEGVEDEAVAEEQAKNTTSFRLENENVCVINTNYESTETTPNLKSGIYLTKRKVKDSELILIFQLINGEKSSSEDIKNAEKIIKTFKLDDSFKEYDPSLAYSEDDADTFSTDESDVESEDSNNLDENNMEQPTTVGRHKVLSAEETKGKISVLTTDKGVIEIELFGEEAPIAVSNHIGLVNEGFYNNLTFHRREEGFVIQGGDPSGNGTGGPGYKFQDETVTRDYDRGIVAMANAGANTNGSQFFVMLDDVPLPPSYTIFGKVISGMDVVDQIKVGDKILKAEIK